MTFNRKLIVIKIATAFSVGLLTGVLTVVGQKYLPGSLNSLANSGAVWLVPSFFIGVWAKRVVPAMLLCVEMLVVCVVSYYTFEAIMNGHTYTLGGYYFFLWLSCAVLFGAIFGIGASFYAQRKRHYHWGASLLPAVFLAEGLNELIHLPDYVHMVPAVIGRILAGLMLYFILYRKDSFGRVPLASFFILTILGTIAFELLFRMAI